MVNITNAVFFYGFSVYSRRNRIHTFMIFFFCFTLPLFQMMLWVQSLVLSFFFPSKSVNQANKSWCSVWMHICFLGGKRLTGRITLYELGRKRQILLGVWAFREENWWVLKWDKLDFLQGVLEKLLGRLNFLAYGRWDLMECFSQLKV